MQPPANDSQNCTCAVAMTLVYLAYLPYYLDTLMDLIIVVPFPIIAGRNTVILGKSKNIPMFHVPLPC